MTCCLYESMTCFLNIATMEYFSYGISCSSSFKMQCESLETKLSIRKSLVQQVEEQSDLCDVTVKMGHWEKKFHRCVLVASPFFNQALTGNFLEKQTGKIEMTVGTPASIEMAILFLYGIEPNPTEENIHDVMKIAEFFLIPQLKTTCIRWLNTVKITEENCLNLLQLASIYDFEIKGCMKYITGHMPEMFHKAQIVNLSEDSVQYILSERKLSYVSMEDKLRFLIKWTNSQPAVRGKYLKDLFGLIDFEDVNNALLEELKVDTNIAEGIDLEKILFSAHCENSNTRNVLIMESQHEGHILWCLHLEKEKWFRVDISAYVEEFSFQFDRICGKGSMSEIYFNGKKDGDTVVSKLNLETDTCIIYKLVKKADRNNFGELSNVNVIGEKFIASGNGRLMIKRKISETDFMMDEEQFRLGPSKMYFESNGLISDFKLVNTAISTLYVGYKINNVVEMSPLLTFKDQIENICINNMFNIAILFESRKVIAVFDLVNNTLETIPLETRYNDKLVQSRDGFVIYNDERCISLIRLTGPTLNAKFKTKEVLFSVMDEVYFNRFIFCEDTWYHYYERDFGKYQFESASHSEVMSNGSTEGVTWKQLPLPKERCYNKTIKGPLYQMCIPKSKLHCDTECPHCTEEDEKWRYSTEESSGSNINESFNTDSSDDDSIWQSVFDDDSEYFNSSDSD